MTDPKLLALHAEALQRIADIIEDVQASLAIAHKELMDKFFTDPPLFANVTGVDKSKQEYLSIGSAHNATLCRAEYKNCKCPCVECRGNCTRRHADVDRT